jgi:hypothetical protein
VAVVVEGKERLTWSYAVDWVLGGQRLCESETSQLPSPAMFSSVGQRVVVPVRSFVSTAKSNGSHGCTKIDHRGENIVAVGGMF